MKHKVKVSVFCAVLVLFSLGTAFTPREYFTFYENRKLAEFPVFSRESLFDGSYFKGMEDYISDQFFYREEILKLYTAKEMALGSPVVNDIVVTPDCLLPYVSGEFSGDASYDRQKFWEETAMLHDLDAFCKQNDIRLLYVGIPEQRTAFSEKYPPYLLSSGYHDRSMQKDFFTVLGQYGIEYLDMEGFLSVDYPHFYSTTDHHFNLYGTYETYLRIMERLSIPVTEEFTITPVDADFIGSHNRKLFGMYKSDDALYTYTTSREIPFERWDNGKKADAKVFDELNRNIYTYYMGGDIPETVIRTGRPELMDALVIGDSFTNAMETFLYRSFDEIHSLDFRYYEGGTIYDYLEGYHPDVLLIIRDDLSYINTDGNGNLSR